MIRTPGNNAARNTLLIVIGLSLMGLFAAVMVWRFALEQETREKIVLHNRMAIVLNGRSDAISKWIEQQENMVRSLGENTSLRLYLNSLSNDLGLEAQGQQALKEFILPLLNDRANQNGFMANIAQPEFEVKANIRKQNHAGLALTNLEGRVIVATSGMPEVIRAVTAYLSAGANQEAIMIGPYEGESGLPTIAVITPVFGIDGDVDTSALGFLVGIRLLDSSFFELLLQPGEVTSTARNYLLTKQNGAIHFIQNNRRSDLQYIPDQDTSQERGDGLAYANPGKLMQTIDYKGDNVLISSTAVAGSEWILARTINSKEALGPAVIRKRNILIISVLGLISLTVLLALIWRHGISVRLQKAIARQKILAEKHEKLSAFMSVVTNSQPTEISAIDKDGNYIFVNLQKALSAGSSPENMIGKTPTAVLGRDRARADELHCEEVLVKNISLSKIRDVGTEDSPKTVKTDYVPIMIGEEGDRRETGVLMVREDITAIEQNRIKRELSLKSLVSTLTMIIGSRDPYSKAHAERVVMVTNVLTKELQIDDTMSATAELAGAMMNLGKILVPRELLVKPENLTGDELAVIRSSMLKSADLIENIEFEGPVSETLRQMQAHWDGTGKPKGLAGEEILPSARIVSVSNAFVGMTSARAHRDGMDMRKAMQILMDEADKIYDRRPVVALMNYLENKGGLEEWNFFNERPSETLK